MASEKTTGLSMLDKLASGIMDDKATKGAKLAPALTPVAGETRVLPNDTGLFLSTETLTQHAASLRAFAADALKIAEGIDVMLGVPAAVEAKATEMRDLDQKLIEQEADRRAADRAKAAEGDKRAEARVATEEPLEKVAGRVNAKREAVIAAMMGAGEGDENPVAAMIAAGDAAAEPFEDRMKRLGDEAKASVFGAATAPAATGDGWSCPEHGTTNLIVKTSPRRGVQFTKCAVADCHEFERV